MFLINNSLKNLGDFIKPLENLTFSISLHPIQCLLQVANNVVWVFEADAEAKDTVAHDVRVSLLLGIIHHHHVVEEK